jgi:hypothetical protein
LNVQFTGCPTVAVSVDGANWNSVMLTVWVG